MGFLDSTDRDFAYKSKLIRANAADPGDIIQVDDDEYGIVLSVEKFGFEFADEDAETRAILDEVRVHGEDDKVSPHFDETVRLMVALATFDDQGKVHLVREARHFPEWGFVRKYS